DHLRVHRGEEIVDRVPEHPEQPGGGDRGDGGKEAGDEPDLDPVAKTAGHIYSMKSYAPGQVKELTGRVALVTGGAQRVGLEIARALADAGADVAIGYRRSAAAARAGAREPRARRARGVRSWRRRREG